MSAFPPATVYSVSRLNRETRLLFDRHFGQVWVEGEISGHSAQGSGHHYFTLKDAEAQVRCALFRGQARLAEVRPANGMHVLVRAEVSLYEPRGDYQLIVLQIRETGDGALMRAFEVLRQKLLAEGLFDAHRKRPLPVLPTGIGLITSPQGAALHDLLSVLKRRFPAIPVVIFPARVQGREAAGDLIRALETADRCGLCDVLILARGGGSPEDLAAFNDEGLARTIARLHTPLVTGIGHEVDYTIADFVADRRAPTPSAAAETVSPDRADWLLRISRLHRQMQRGFLARLQARSAHWLQVDKRLLSQHPRHKLTIHLQRLDERHSRLLHALQRRLRQARERLTLAEARLHRHHPRQRISQSADKQDYLRHRLLRAFDQRLTAQHYRLAVLGERLQAISPLATLSRGYSITRRADTGQLIRSINDIPLDHLLETRVADGTLISRVCGMTTP